jgi:hypothetical protein
MPTRLVFVLLLTGCALPVHDPITATELQGHVDVLASDAFLGREAGSAGERLASDYLIEHLVALPGLEPAGDDGGWLQAFPIPAGIVAVPTTDLGDGHNVLAVLPGSDSRLANEIIVVGAHYDHVGTGSHGNSLELFDHLDELIYPETGKPRGFGGDIHNGADDNGSGTAVLLELAESLATSPQPLRRTVMFQWYSGEELGLLGSRHYVAHPTRPLADTVAMLNMDMVGRLRGSTVFAGGTGSSAGFSRKVAAAAASEELFVVEDPSGLAPTDSSPFYVADVPIVFLFTGMHEDYHRPGDDPDKLNAVGTARVGRMLEHMLRAIDADDERPGFELSGGDVLIWKPNVWFGLTLDATVPGELGAARIAVLVPESPAGRAGLAEGDVIFKLDGVRVITLEELEASLAVTDPARSPRTLDVWRAYPGEEPTLDDDWLDVYELLSFELHPVVR